MRGNLLALVPGEFLPTNYIISNLYPYSEKMMVIAQKILQSSGLLIKSTLMQNELSESPYPKERF
jgi:hypothetical protein